MQRIKCFVKNNPQLFEYLSADFVNPHDQLVAKVFLPLLPASVTPNRLTVLRIFMTPIVFLIILFGHYLIGSILFLLTAFTDVLDGSMARTQNKITRFGMMFDPLADKLLIGSMVLLLVFEHLNFWLGIAVLGIEIIFIVSALVAHKKFKTVRMANFWGKFKMVLQVIAVFVILLALLFNEPYLFSVASWFFGLAIGFALVSLFNHGI